MEQSVQEHAQHSTYHALARLQQKVVDASSLWSGMTVSSAVSTNPSAPVTVMEEVTNQDQSFNGDAISGK